MVHWQIILKWKERRTKKEIKYVKKMKMEEHWQVYVCTIAPKCYLYMIQLPMFMAQHKKQQNKRKKL